jgi:hypothetical protein
MAVGPGLPPDRVIRVLYDAVCEASIGAAAESYANGWRRLTVHVDPETGFRDVDDLLAGVHQAASGAGYDGGHSAFFVSHDQWLCWSWCIRDQPIAHVVALARDVADALNPGTWSVDADLS